MTPEQFVYWLQGFAEVNGGNPPSSEQWRIIQDHLQLLFDKKIPSYPPFQPVPRDPFTPVQPAYVGDPHPDFAPRIMC